MTDKHNVRKGLTIVFGDDEERTVYPLTLNALRKFVVVVDKMSETQDLANMTEKDVEYMIEAASIILDKVDPKLARDTEALGDAVDLVIFNQLMSVAMGAASPEA